MADEIAKLRAEVDQLRRERDEALSIASRNEALAIMQAGLRERAERERDEAKRCTHCKGTGRATVVVTGKWLGDGWEEHEQEDECPQCEGKGQDR